MVAKVSTCKWQVAPNGKIWENVELIQVVTFGGQMTIENSAFCMRGKFVQQIAPLACTMYNVQVVQ